MLIVLESRYFTCECIVHIFLELFQQNEWFIIREFSDKLRALNMHVLQKLPGFFGALCFIKTIYRPSADFCSYNFCK